MVRLVRRETPEYVERADDAHGPASRGFTDMYATCASSKQPEDRLCSVERSIMSRVQSRCADAPCYEVEKCDVIAGRDCTRDA